jgi:hypothetical protein
MENLEQWKSIPGEPLLEASSLGRIRRLARQLVVAERDALGRSKGNFRKEVPAGIMRPWLQSTGYLVVSYRLNGKRNKRLVHRLVAKAFVAGEFDGATVDHIDGNRLNNLPDNLEWVTLAENSRRQGAQGRGAGRGINHASGKLDDAHWPAIVALRASGKSLSECGAAFGVSGSLIHKIEKGVRRPWLQSSPIVQGSPPVLGSG